MRSHTRNRFPELTPANLCWCLDGTGKVDTLGVNHFIFGILDHGSRKILTLKRLVRANAATTLAEVRNAVALFGKPSMIRTDNASIFHSRVFRAGIAELGIQHEFIPPIDGAALDKLLPDFAFWYNAVRPHQHLHGFTSLEDWRGIDPYRTAPKEVIPFSAWDGIPVQDSSRLKQSIGVKFSRKGKIIAVDFGKFLLGAVQSAQKSALVFSKKVQVRKK